MGIRPARWLAGIITAGAMAIGVGPASAQQFESSTADVSAPLSIEQRMQAMEEELIQLRKLSNTRFASMELETAEADGPKKDDAKKGDGSYEVGGVKVKKIVSSSTMPGSTKARKTWPRSATFKMAPTSAPCA